MRTGDIIIVHALQLEAEAPKPFPKHDERLGTVVSRRRVEQRRTVHTGEANPYA